MSTSTTGSIDGVSNLRAKNLQLAINANAAVKSLLNDANIAALERLEQASDALSELIENLEEEFVA